MNLWLFLFQLQDIVYNVVFAAKTYRYFGNGLSVYMGTGLGRNILKLISRYPGGIFSDICFQRNLKRNFNRPIPLSIQSIPYLFQNVSQLTKFCPSLISIFFESIFYTFNFQSQSYTSLILYMVCWLFFQFGFSKVQVSSRLVWFTSNFIILNNVY